MRGLRLVGGTTASDVIDAGNANADGNFRYTDGSYTFNLKTTGLVAGTYTLSFYLGNDQNFFYTVKFQVK